MTKSNYYITTHGILKRKDNNIYFYRKCPNGSIEKKVLPINKIYSIYIYSRVSLSSGCIDYLLKNGVSVHFFNNYGYYKGGLYPQQKMISGNLVISQVQHFLDKKKRIILAKKFVEGGVGNIVRNLQYYGRNKVEFAEILDKVKTLSDKLDSCQEISEIMSVEGNVREAYYNSFNMIFPPKFHFDKRTKRPPRNMINCLISFGNSLLYSTILTEIYHTYLNPTVSYLHEPFERRFSLSLDIGEVFKPIIVDRVIFKLINKGIIDDSHFVKNFEYVLLNEEGKKVFLHYFDEKLKTKIKHRQLKRSVSFRRLIRLECYKIIKHLLGIKEFEPFVIWW